MSDVCEICGLPKDLCMCATVAKEQQQVNIKIVKRRYGKLLTLIGGIDKKQVDLRKLAKQLKSELACGGTVKNDVIELQGEHKVRVKEILSKLGFTEDSIAIA